MLNIGFELEDNSLCAGCPLDIEKAFKCKAGFPRQYLKVEEVEGEEDVWQQTPAGTHFVGRQKTSVPKSSWVRPQTCIVVAEVKPKFGGTLSKNMTIFSEDFLKKPTGKGAKSEEKKP